MGPRRAHLGRPIGLWVALHAWPSSPHWGAWVRGAHRRPRGPWRAWWPPGRGAPKVMVRAWQSHQRKGRREGPTRSPGYGGPSSLMELLPVVHPLVLLLVLLFIYLVLGLLLLLLLLF